MPTAPPATPSFIACIGWEQMASCQWDGRRNRAGNGRCDETIASNRSGFCVCLLPPANGMPPFSFPLRPVPCGHRTFTCSEECGLRHTKPKPPPVQRQPIVERHESRQEELPPPRHETKEEKIARLMANDFRAYKSAAAKTLKKRWQKLRRRRRRGWTAEDDAAESSSSDFVGPSCVSITSIWLPHLASLAPSFDSTLFSRTLKMPLVAYYNGAGRLPRKFGPRVSWVNLSVAQPWAEQAAAALPRSWLTRKEWDALPPCVGTAKVPSRYAFCCWAHTDDGRASRACHDERTVYKIAAMYDAVISVRASSNASSFVLWLDLDVFWQTRLDARFWRFTAGFDVATIGRKHGWPPETGVVALRRAPVVSEMLGRMRNAFTRQPAGLQLLSAAASANDVKLFQQQLEGNPSLRVGLYAVGCRRGLARSLSWVESARTYKERDEQYCPGESRGVSPFNLLEYLTHVKRGKGPVSFNRSS